MRQLHSHLHCHSSIHGWQARQAGTLANCQQARRTSFARKTAAIRVPREEREREKKKKKSNKTPVTLLPWGGRVQCVGAPCTCAYLRTAFTTCSPVLERPERKKRARRRSQGWRIKGKWIKDKHIMLTKERVYVFPEDWPIGKAKIGTAESWKTTEEGGGGGWAVFDEQEPWYALFFQIFAG